MVDVILVNEKDEKIGTEEKIAAHEKALLHRAFSLIILNSKGDMLLQKRADSKYHAGGLWTNACCSHPFDKELVEDAVHRRTKEEIGYDNLTLKKNFEYIYKVKLNNNLYEHEYLHVYTSIVDSDPPALNPEEVSDFMWISKEKLLKEVYLNPNKFTPWFLLTLKRYYSLRQK